MAALAEKVLTRHVGLADQADLRAAAARGAYQTLRKALSTAPEAVVESVKASGLRGRGGAGFPTGVKWTFMPKETSKPKYLVVNADESEPGTFKDRLLMERDPHLCLEGILISAWALRASIAFIYIRGEFVAGWRTLGRAIEQAREAGLIGRDVLGSGWDIDVILHRGAGAYICGEETALMESLEGKRGYPRLKPPFPATFGVYGNPTTINNVETLAVVPAIVERGAEWFAGIGREKNTGPKLYCLSGHVRRPGVYETELGIPFPALFGELGGGPLDPKRKLKAVIPGGSSAPVMTAGECGDLLMDFDGLAAKGSMLGSAGIMMMDDSVCMVRALERVLRFYAHESCGQCTPCRVGSDWIHRIVARIERGEGTTGDLETLVSVCDGMVGKTICVFADAAALPAKSFVAKFRHEFNDHISRKACPFGAARG
ncbi:MAG TPA: NADH-quinone oxidoreductase subunit NuoF [Candidatus Polarisedimenticolia bacterium]|nr:NADH-quinone oxidoreductase subunit NuoF [Candidatus Polarisedimenticolia bacterium]